MLDSLYAIHITNIGTFIETYDFDCCNLIPLFPVCGFFLSQLVAIFGECRVKPNWCVPCSAWCRYLPTKVTSSKQLLWSLQDDQDATLWTCHILKVSRWKIYQLFQWIRVHFLISMSTSCTLLHYAQWGNK